MKTAIPMQRLSAELLAGDTSEPRRAKLRWYSGAVVQRRPWFGEPYSLQFSMDPAHVRLGRINSGNAPLLNSHRDGDLGDVIGVIERAWLANGEGLGEIRFSDRDEVAPIVADVKAGILRNVSMGVAIFKLQDTTPKGAEQKSFLAVDWEPQEVSVVAVNADPAAMFLEGSKTFECEIVSGATAPDGEHMETNSTQTAGQLTPEDIARIRKIGQTLNMAELAEEIAVQPKIA